MKVIWRASFPNSREQADQSNNNSGKTEEVVHKSGLVPYILRLECCIPLSIRQQCKLIYYAQ